MIVEPVLETDVLADQVFQPFSELPRSHMGGAAMPNLAADHLPPITGLSTANPSSQPLNQVPESQVRSSAEKKGFPAVINQISIPPHASQIKSSRKETHIVAGSRDLHGLTINRILLSSTADTGEQSPRSLRRHGRISSTGNRATVMDVARTLLERQDTPASFTQPPSGTMPPTRPPDLEETRAKDRAIGHVDYNSPAVDGKLCDRHLASTMPSITEEKFPSLSLVGSLNQHSAHSIESDLQDVHKSQESSFSEQISDMPIELIKSIHNSTEICAAVLVFALALIKVLFI